MTTSEKIRVVLIIVLAIVYLGKRYDVVGKLREKKQKKQKLEAEQRRRKELKEQRQQQQEQQAEKKVQTAQILKRGLGHLRQKSVQAAGQEMWYLEGGARPDARQVLMLHGFAGDKENWGEVAKLLIAKGFHLVIPDLPGFGQNVKDSRKSYDVTTQTKRVRAFLQKTGLQSFHLVGHSVGASIAAAIAYSMPKDVKSLTLIEPIGIRVPYESELDRMLAQNRNPLVIAIPAAYDNLLGFVFHKPPEMPLALKKLRAEQAAENRVFYLKVWKEIREGERANLLDLLLPVIKLKTLVVHGAQSKVVHPATPGMVKEIMSNAHSAIIQSCGHFPMLEQPKATADHLLRFFEAIPAQPATRRLAPRPEGP